MERAVSPVVLDTHVVHWWSAEPTRLSHAATQAIESASDVLIADITWYELAWMAAHERIVISVPISTWLTRLSHRVRSIPATPSIAATAIGLPRSFPRDPADRLIYATAIEIGARLITKDEALRSHAHPTLLAVW